MGEFFFFDGGGDRAIISFWSVVWPLSIRLLFFFYLEQAPQGSIIYRFLGPDPLDEEEC